MAPAIKASAVRPTFSVELVAPALARRYLERNVCNRKISRATVRRYAECMLRGEWQLNGETLKFDEEGRLIDGQHRLLAIIECGRAVELGVFRRIKHAAFATIDSGKNRSSGDTLSTLGVTYPNETAAAARLLAVYVGKLAPNKRLSNMQLIDLVDAHPDLIRCVETATKPPLNARLLTSSQRGFCYYAMSRVDPARAEQFLAELAAGRYADQRSQPIFLLRGELAKEAQSIYQIQPRAKLGWVITAWNAFVARRKLAALGVERDSLPRFNPEPFK